MNKIEWTRKAVKQLHKISEVDKEPVVEKVSTLKRFPNCLHVKKLKGATHLYRLRVGRYRVLFAHLDTVRIVRINEVKKRDERTY